MSAPQPRLFDHFTGDEPELRRFSWVARSMRDSADWWLVTKRTEQADVSGEIEVAR